MKYKFKKPKRFVSRVFDHCSDSDNPDHDNPETIKKWHTTPDKNDPSKPWDDNGYQLVITKDGVVHECRSMERQPAAQYPHNRDTIAICLTGRHEFSEAQRNSLLAVTKAINEAYEGNITFHGHKEVDPYRTCPNYPYKDWLDLDENGKFRG